MITRTLGLAVVLAVLPAQAPAAPSPEPDGSGLVECRLPPQIRSLGRNMTYMAAGRQVRIPASDCQIRGGTYDGRGPGSKAGHTGTIANGRSVVMVGGDKDHPACPGSGLVSGISQGGTLSVRAAPGTNSPRVDRLSNGASVFMCDWTADGAWVGVIYAAGAKGDCGVSEPLTPSRGYAGSCKSGWVSARYLK